MTISQHIPAPIKRVSRSLGFALWLGDFSAWNSLTTILRLRLSEEQRAALAYAALRSLDPEHAEIVAGGAIDGMAYFEEAA